MDSKTLIRILPLIGIIVGLLIGEQTRPTFMFTKIPLSELFEALSSHISTDKEIAKNQLMHVGTNGVVGGVLGFVVSLFLQKQAQKED